MTGSSLPLYAFWFSVCWITFSYVGYLMITVLLALVINRRVIRGNDTPRVTFLITAYNEEKHIARKIEQTLQLDYPRDQLEVLVASDGSTDNTDAIVGTFKDRGVRLLRVEGRLGKTGTQNRAVESASGEIILFSDATTRYDPSAIRKLIRNFADPSVGAVSGRYEYFNPTGASIGIGNILFWKYENLIKTLQSRIGTLTGCCGCIYAVRRSAYTALPPDVISDLCEPLMVIRGGRRVVFEPEAIAFEETTERAKEEFKMRVRVVVRGMRGLLYARQLLNPVKYPLVAIQLLSHKVSRWFAPVFMIVAYISSAALAGEPMYRAAWLAQTLFYLLAVAGHMTEGTRYRTRFLSIPLYLSTVNVAALVALMRVVQGHRAVVWETVRK